MFRIARYWVCSGSTPNSPSKPGATTSSTSSVRRRRSGVTSSSRIFDAIVFDLCLRRGEQLLALLDRLLDGPDHVEGLLGEVVVLPVDDLLERPDRVLEADVFPRDPGELLGDEERLG